MEFDNKSWQKIEHNAPREQVVDAVKSLILQAKNIPIDHLIARGEYKNPNTKFPQTIGEKIADALSYLLASQDWIDNETEPILGEMFSIISQLDMDVSDSEDWRELFLISEKLN